MPRIPRHSSRSEAQAQAAWDWQKIMGLGIAAGGALLWLGQLGHHLAAS